MPPTPHLPAAHEPAVLAIFVLTYLGVAAGRVPGLKIDRTGIVMLGAIAMMIFSGLPNDAVIASINWPTLFLLFGFFVLSAQLRLCGFFDAVAGAIAGRIGHPARFLLLLMVSAAGLSAVLNNDIVCYVFAPIVAEALIRKRRDPVPFLIALAVACNIGAAATFVGNAQNMMIAQLAGLNLGRYMAWSLPPVLFALGCAYLIIWRLSRRRFKRTVDIPPAKGETAYRLDRAHAAKGLVILVVVIALLFTGLPKDIIALTAAAIHLASPKYRTSDILGLVDWPVLVLFMGLFVVTGGFQATDFAGHAGLWLGHHGLDLNAPRELAIATAALSNLINNSAAVMLLVRFVALSRTSVACALALGNSFGGNLIIVGSVANIIVVQMAREKGVSIGFREFARLGVPVTLVALAGLIAWVSLV